MTLTRDRSRRFTDGDILRHIRRVSSGQLTSQQLVQELGISMYTYYKWRENFKGMTPSRLGRLRYLLAQNKQLRDLLIDETLRADALQEQVEAMALAQAESQG